MGKAILAAGMLFEDFCRLESKLKNFQNAENEMLKPKATNDHLTWHTNCQQALKSIFEQWTNSNDDMKWVSTNLVYHLQETGHCLTFCRLEDKLRHGYPTALQLNQEIEALFRKKERSAKIAPLVDRYNQLLEELNQIDDQNSRHLKLEANKSMRSAQSERQTIGLDAVENGDVSWKGSKTRVQLLRYLLECRLPSAHLRRT